MNSAGTGTEDQMLKEWLPLSVGIFTVSFLLTCLSVPCFARLAKRMRLLDVPASEHHKNHVKATPLLGGAAMAAGWAVCAAPAFLARLPVFTPIFSRFLPAEMLSGMVSAQSELAIVFLCAFASLFLGLADDIRPMKPRWKFTGQLLISVAAVLFGGIRISLFLESALLSGVLTVLWLLFIFNATNFFDNMDGLAAGMASIAFLMFTAAAAFQGQYLVAALSLCAAGAVSAFWIFNMPPASIFMGDAGSHFLGFLLGAASVKVTYFNPEIASSRFAVLIPLFILAVPVFDTFAVIIIRLRQGKPVHVGDNNHISHRFLHAGFSRLGAVQMVHLLCLTMGLGALPILWGDWKTCLILFLQGVSFFFLLSMMQYAVSGISSTPPHQATNGKDSDHEQKQDRQD